MSLSFLARIALMDDRPRSKSIKTPLRPGSGKITALPESLAAEAAVLGSMMVDPFCVPDVMDKLSATDFFHSEHAVIFQAIRDLYEANDCKGVNGLLVRQRLEDKTILDQIGGIAYLQKVLETLPSSASVDYYVNIVKEKSLRRRWYLLGEDMLTTSLDTSQEIDEICDVMESKILTAFERPKARNDLSCIPDLLMDVYRAVEKREDCRNRGVVQGLGSGFHEIDEMTSGFHPGDMVIIAGRPSMGKTAIALNMLDYVTRVCRKPAVIFSLEMGRYLLAERQMASLCEVNSNKLRRGIVTVEDYAKLQKAAELLKDTSLLIHDESTLTPFQLRSKARKLKREHKIEMIVVDYLQLMHVGGKIENRQQEITTISRQIKSLARELEVPVIVLSQLNRGPEGREDHRPRMSDLRESGSLEQDADLVILLHREAYYHKGEAGWENNEDAEVIIAKQRNGPTGIAKLRFRGEFTRFDSPTMAYFEPVKTIVQPAAEIVQAPTQGSMPWDL